jgi:hypothetical protein
VKLNETVRTDASGQARLILVDSTVVAILSGSTMTVERYAPGSKIMSTPDGTFTIHTGHGSAGELQINTSAGTLTPQGTRFWYDVRGGRIKLDVQEGAVRFCPRGKSQAYCVVATPGHDVIGSAGAPAQIQGTAEPPREPPISPAPINYNGAPIYYNDGGANTNSGGPPYCYQTRGCGCGSYHRFDRACGTRGWNSHGGAGNPVGTVYKNGGGDNHPTWRAPGVATGTPTGVAYLARPSAGVVYPARSPTDVVVARQGFPYRRNPGSFHMRGFGFLH